MNHIARLQADLAEARASAVAKDTALQEFWCHLASVKFTGFEADGGRKDWIATRDVDAWLSRINQAGA